MFGATELLPGGVLAACNTCHPGCLRDRCVKVPSVAQKSDVDCSSPPGKGYDVAVRRTTVSPQKLLGSSMRLNKVVFTQRAFLKRPSGKLPPDALYDCHTALPRHFNTRPLGRVYPGTPAFRMFRRFLFLLVSKE